MSAYTLLNADSIQVKVGTASAINASISSADEITSSVDSFKILVPPTLITSTSVTSLYSPGGATKSAIISQVKLANVTGVAVTGCIVYINGTAAGNQETGTITVPANGTVIINSKGITPYGSDGIPLTTIGGAAGGDLAGAYPNPTIKTDVALSGNPTTTTQSANNNSTRIATTAYVDTADALKVPTSRTISTTAPLTGGGDLSANRTLAITAASTSAAGSQSAIDKLKEDNLWYDVTANSIAILVGDDLTDNTTNWNTLFAALPVGATVYFPSGTYRTSTGFNISADKHLRIRGAGKYVTYIKTTNATGNGFQINGSYWYNTFEDMGFTHLLTGSSVTGGAGININPGASGSAVGTNIYRCSFVGLFVGIRAVGSQAANLSVWDSVDISAASVTANAVPNARGILWNGDTINMVISNSTINMIFPAPAFSQFPAAGTACMEINQSGAIQLIGGEFIGGTNTLLLNASAGGTTSVAAVYATNSFFDQSNGSTLKITGANIVNRVKFVQCGITTGNTGATGAIAVEIASSGTGAAGTATAAADGIDFFDCDIYPNGVTGTTNGFQITGAQGVAINSCRISGFTNGITVTPVASNGYTKVQISNNKMGATNNFTTPNTTGLNLNAGSFQYGAVKVSDNDFTGSTTPVVDNSTVAQSWQKNFGSNIGLANIGNIPTLPTAAQSLPASATTLVTGTSIPIPTNGLLPGMKFRFDMNMIKTTAAGVTAWSAAVKFGTANTTADTAINTFTSGTNTGAIDTAQFSIIVEILTVGSGTSATCKATCEYIHNLAAATGLSVLPVNGTATAFNSTLTSGFLHLDITHGALIVATGTAVGYQIA